MSISELTDVSTSMLCISFLVFFAEAHLVPLGDTESEDHVSSGTMASLVVMVVNKDQCISPVHHAPVFAEVLEVL